MDVESATATIGFRMAGDHDGQIGSRCDDTLSVVGENRVILETGKHLSCRLLERIGFMCIAGSGFGKRLLAGYRNVTVQRPPFAYPIPFT